MALPIETRFREEVKGDNGWLRKNKEDKEKRERHQNVRQGRLGKR